MSPGANTLIQCLKWSLKAGIIFFFFITNGSYDYLNTVLVANLCRAFIWLYRFHHVWEFSVECFSHCFGFLTCRVTVLVQIHNSHQQKPAGTTALRNPLYTACSATNKWHLLTYLLAFEDSGAFTVAAKWPGFSLSCWWRTKISAIQLIYEWILDKSTIPNVC